VWSGNISLSEESVVLVSRPAAFFIIKYVFRC
jgi:hypothetical protein